MKTRHGRAFSLVLLLVSYLTFKPVPGRNTGLVATLSAAIFVVIFGFLFVTVSSRITGLIGTSSNPISGMAIATLMATCALFLIAWAGRALHTGALAIAIGGVVCIASANAGNTSQDLKTGFLVGATPRHQQLALLIGVAVSVVAIGWTLGLMNEGLEQIRAVKPISIDLAHMETGIREVPAQDNELLKRADIKVSDEKGNTLGHEDPRKYQLLVSLGAATLANGQYLYNPATGSIERQWIQGIGSEKAAAPQASLMATVVTGIIDHRLNWNLVLIGVFIVIGIELLGIRSLSFAVGSTSALPPLSPFSLEELSAGWWTGLQKAGEKKEESDVSPGSLYASGLIAAGGVMGLIGIVIKVLEKAPESKWYHMKEGLILLTDRIPALGHSNLLSVIMFVLLAASAYYFARKPIPRE